jgi:hypothetical protein
MGRRPAQIKAGRWEAARKNPAGCGLPGDLADERLAPGGDGTWKRRGEFSGGRTGDG